MPLCFVLSGCAYQVIHFPDENVRSGDINNTTVSSVPSSGYHRAILGESLFSIAFSYGVNYREVADLNHISAPYTIYPKQKIWLKKRSWQTKAPLSFSQQVVAKKPKEAIVASDIKLQKKVNIPKKTTYLDTQNSKKVSSWQWPIVGKVIKGFSNNGVSNKGIDIKGHKGELVKSVADGTVVYAGDGLIGYGNLVIVKHNDVYISAYAYSEMILAKEGQNVKAGDALSVIGGKGNDDTSLHFEIRRDGQPIDPLKLLPKR